MVGARDDHKLHVGHVGGHRFSDGAIPSSAPAIASIGTSAILDSVVVARLASHRPWNAATVAFRASAPRGRRWRKADATQGSLTGHADRRDAIVPIPSARTTDVVQIHDV